MITIAILRERDLNNGSSFSAIARSARATGRTVGEALDALTARQGEEQGMAIVQLFDPDQFFSEAKQQRLSTLMADWRKSQEAGSTLPASKQEELQRLIDEELEAAGERAEQIPQIAVEEAILRSGNVLANSRMLARYAVTVGILQLVLAALLLWYGFNRSLWLSVIVVVLVSLSVAGFVFAGKWLSQRARVTEQMFLSSGSHESNSRSSDAE